MLDQTSLPDTLKHVDQLEFGALIEPHRRELRAHCYRMLGSVEDAEDMVQETFLRAWARRETYEARSTLRAWLYKIATNQCLDALRKKPRRGLPISREEASTLEQPIPVSINEPIWLEPYSDDLPAPSEANPESNYARSEYIRLAFVTSLHLLPPRQRAALILRDVLDWQADEVADALDQTVPAVKSALHRARTTIDKYRETLHLDAINPYLADVDLRGKLDLFVRAWQTADVDGLVSLLREDATFSMPPIPSWYQGRETIGGLVRKTVFGGQANGRWRLLPTRANGQPGFGLYKLNEGNGNHEAYGIQVVTFDGDRIVDIITFRDPLFITRFNLPTVLTA